MNWIEFEYGCNEAELEEWQIVSKAEAEGRWYV